MKNLRIIMALMSLFVFTLSFSFAQSVTGNGTVVEQERPVGSFTGVKVQQGIDLYLSMGSTEKVIVKADENIIDLVETKVSGDMLEISLSKGIRQVKNLDVYVTVSELNHLESSSGSDVEGEGLIKADRLTIEASSGSDIDLELEANELTVEVSSGSDVNLSGAVNTMRAEASSGSDLDARKMETAKCIIRVYGGADAWVNASEEIDMEASGGSDIHYRGEAKVVRSKASGSSDIHRQ